VALDALAGCLCDAEVSDDQYFPTDGTYSATTPTRWAFKRRVGRYRLAPVQMVGLAWTGRRQRQVGYRSYLVFTPYFTAGNCPAPASRTRMPITVV